MLISAERPYRILVIGAELQAEDIEDIRRTGVPVDVRFHDLFPRLKGMSRAAATQEALAVVDAFGPDMVFCNVGVANENRWVDFSFNDVLRRRGVTLVCFVADSWPSLHSCELLWLSKCDVYVQTDKYTNHSRLSRVVQGLGLSTRVHYWPALNSIIGHYADQREEPQTFDVTFLGRTPTSWRRQLVTHLRQALPEHGIRFDHLNAEGNVSNSDYARLIMRSKISVNCLTSMGTTFQIKWRVQELVASNAMPLIEENPETRKLIPNDCAVFYDGLADCVDKARYYMAHADERHAIAENGRAWYSQHFERSALWHRLIGDSLPVVSSSCRS